MQQDINTHPTEIFKQVLAGPARLNDEILSSLQTLLYSFPQCGLLYAIQARSGSAADLNLAAARFSDSATLQKTVQWPGSLPPVNPAQVIIKSAKPKAQQAIPTLEIPVIEAESEAPVVTESVKSTYYEVLNDADTASDINEPEQVFYTQAPAAEKDNVQSIEVEQQEPFDETQKLIIENIASTDYFVFDRAFVDRDEEAPAAIAKEEVTPLEPAVIHQAPPPAPEEGQVTRYHDDKMPYSFMWWLDKTRNKHSGVYQPFAAPLTTKEERQPPAPVPVENIPHEVIDSRKKEDELLDRFIHEAPQIKPPSGDKLDSENKAKVSVEDHEELITETLARIYADQMLYSKAIAAYKILMLKNPEKRRYFATQIEVLEKKIN